MRLAGLLFMPAGWIIILATLALLPPGPAQGAFVLTGAGLEVVGLVIVARSYAVEQGEQK
jgi:hypothetical protein